jgi:multidrug efflux system membrane fusion protein
MRRRVWIGIGVIILLVAAIAFALISGSDDATTGNSAPPATPVTMVAVVEGDVPIELDALGRVQAANTVTVRAQVAGQIQGAHPGELCGGTSLEPTKRSRYSALFTLL